MFPVPVRTLWSRLAQACQSLPPQCRAQALSDEGWAWAQKKAECRQLERAIPPLRAKAHAA